MDKNKNRNLEPGKRMLAVLFAVFLASTMVLPAGVMSGQVTENVPDAPGPSPVPVSAGGGNDAIETVTLQPNATVGKDTIITTQFIDSNYGIRSDILIGNGSFNFTGLVQFDVSTKPALVLSATLSLYAYGKAGQDINISAYPVTNYWDEGVENGAIGTASNWSYRTDTLQWTSPGGDFDINDISYIETPSINTWYNWNVTSIVQKWISGSMINNGFLLSSDNPNPVIMNYMNFWSSDYTTDTNLTPKLTISYAAEIDPPVPAQILSEDDPTLNVDLSGRGHGSIVHVSGPNDLASAQPFFGTGGSWMNYMTVFTPDQVGAEGVIKRISFNRTLGTSETGVFNNVIISLAHTNRTDLVATTFPTNYNGYLVEVFKETNVELNSSNGDSWIHFDLNDNFTYDSSHNLIVYVQWNGDDGNTLNLDCTNFATTKTIWETDLSGGIQALARLLMTEFTTDVVDNAVVDEGTAQNFWPFCPNDESEMRFQMLYNKSLINESGTIDKIAFQGYRQYQEWSVMENLIIRIAHSTNDSLEMVFDAHNSSPWVEVFNSPSFNLSYDYQTEWMPINLVNSFAYNGIDNLVIDIRWFGGYGIDPGTNPGLDLCVNNSAGYESRAYQTNYSATVAMGTSQDLYNIQIIFLESANLSWSASSSNNNLFTVNNPGSGTNLAITPVADAFGTGTLTLTLTNSNGEGVSQLIPVTINAVNDAPLLSGVPTDIHCIEDVDYVLNVTTYASDIDNPFSDLTFSTDSAHAFVTGAEITFNYPEGITSEFVNITVRDPGGLTFTVMVLVTITPVNDLPQLTGFVDTFSCEATIAKTYTVHPVDEETVTGQLMIYTSSIYATVTNHAIFFLYPKDIGSESVTIYLVDEDMYGRQNNISYVLAVTINDHPEVTAHSPNGTGVAVTTTIEVTFDMAMNRTITETAFSLTYDTTELNGTFSWNAGSTIVTFTPSSVLTNGVYDVSVGTGARSATGHNMFAAYSWNFTAALGSYDGDGDGMPDQYELDNGLDPATDDSAGDKDGDGMPNLWEYTYDLNPSVNDADLDPDDDGFSNLEEYEAGTSPTNPDDKPAAPLPWMLIILILVIVVVLAIVGILMKNRGKGSKVPDQPYEGPPAEEPYESPPAEEPYEEPPADEPYTVETPEEVIEPVQEDVPPPPPPPPAD